MAAGLGAATGIGGAVAGGWPAVVVLGLPVVALVVLLVWVAADAGRSRRLADLIRAARPASAAGPLHDIERTKPGDPA